MLKSLWSLVQKHLGQKPGKGNFLICFRLEAYMVYHDSPKLDRHGEIHGTRPNFTCQENVDGLSFQM